MQVTHSGPLSTTVAVEASSLGGPWRDRASFVEFVLGSPRPAEVEIVTWSLRPLSRSLTEGRAVTRRAGARVARAAASVGAVLPARWVAPRADLVHLASGPALLRLSAPAIVTVHRADAALIGADPKAKRALELLRQSTGEGVLVHAVTDEVADALVQFGRIERSSIVVAHPGVRGREIAPSEAGPPAIGVLAGRDPAHDRATVDAISAIGGADAAIVGASVRPRCCLVVASPEAGFPTEAIEALSAGTPVVMATSPTAISLLGGAVQLVDDGVVAELAEAAIELATNEAARAVAVAAGRARALDFSWERRASDLMAAYRRALHPR